MSKELTPLEALERLYDYPNLHNRNIVAYLLEQENLPTYRKIIETALKDYEWLKAMTTPLDENAKKDIMSVAKRLKALEIIKNKTNFNQANNSNGTKQNCLVMVVLDNDKDFDLLKDVLK